jgi:hypothetical protein
MCLILPETSSDERFVRLTEHQDDADIDEPITRAFI